MRRLIIAVVVLVGVLVVVDFAAAAAAESAVSRQMRERLSLPEDPSVRINGVSFLAQAATGDYRSVDVSMERLQVGPLRDVEVKAKLRDVRAPLGDLLSGTPRFRITGAEGIISIGASDVLRTLPGVTELVISDVDANAISEIVEAGGDPTLRNLDPRNAALLTATTTVGGEEQEIEVLSALQITGDGQVRITPRDIRPAGGNAEELPNSVRNSLTRAFTVVLDPGGLPFKVTPTALRTNEGTLEISGQVRDLVIGEGERSSSAQG
ncbi:DUF2993 domain-containing protein [Pseudonocardia sp. KRD291]|uniref:LmeA family phospholipid-binding protein n=1 Tax=Pseudonocardia sp. KRD291 TaxID=2792007 RepID=UPI001C49EE71|nr:DUF2993 domain-containing protein [Pseudonocardia sp. KRD291]MBW0104245.1 DUF2993 domain-containing protein [Pseudonocardia sp. KRD291]